MHARIVSDSKLRRNRKTTAYRLRTNVICKLMLYIKLTSGSFLKAFFNLLSFGFLERTSDFQTASAGACWTSQVCVVTGDGPNEAEGLGQGHREFPGIADPQNSRREFPGISEMWNSGGNYGEFREFCLFPFFCWLYDILVFNLTAFWAKPWMTSLTQLFVWVPVYFEILISKNHWTASEFRKLRLLHEWGRWDNSNRS